jgi:hypothetical protein
MLLNKQHLYFGILKLEPRLNVTVQIAMKKI